MIGAKICGVTRPADAALATRLGAVRIGVIFAGGPRQVTTQQAREIVEAAGEVPVLAVVRPGGGVDLAGLVESTGIRGIQFHGAVEADVVRQLQSHGLEVWCQVALREGDPLETLVSAAAALGDRVLVEPRDGEGHSGGRGLQIDLDLAIRARRLLANQRMVLAGGLTPETVAEVIHRVQPDLVDVSSGVESAPGIKDPERLLRFLEEVRDVRTPD